jgi:hypothetical protein
VDRQVQESNETNNVATITVVVMRWKRRRWRREALRTFFGAARVASPSRLQGRPLEKLDPTPSLFLTPLSDGPSITRS